MGWTSALNEGEEISAGLYREASLPLSLTFSFSQCACQREKECSDLYLEAKLLLFQGCFFLVDALALSVLEQTHQTGWIFPAFTETGSVNNSRAICSAQVISRSLTNGIQQMSSWLRFIWWPVTQCRLVLALRAYHPSRMKEIVHPKITYTHLHVIPNLYDFLPFHQEISQNVHTALVRSSIQWKWKGTRGCQAQEGQKRSSMDILLNISFCVPQKKRLIYVLKILTTWGWKNNDRMNVLVELSLE